MDIALDEVLHFDAVTHVFSTGAVSDADSTPTWSIFEEDTDTAILSAQNFTKRTSLTGNYRGSVTLSAANGFEIGKWYNVIGSATVSTVAGKAVIMRFRVVSAESVVGQPKVDAAALGGNTQSILDLKDFADDGYDPATNKVQGVVLVDLVTLATTVTTLTNLPAITASWLTAAGIANDAITAAKIADGAIDAATFAAGAITAAAIATDAIGSDEVAASAVTKIQSGLALAATALSTAQWTNLRAGYLDNLNIGGNVASSAEVVAIQNNTRVVRVVPDVIERPDSSTTPYRIELLLYDAVGNMEVPDSAPTIALVDESGTDRSSRLDSTTMALVSTGRYRAIYTASVTDDLEQLVWTFSVVEGGATRLYGNASLVVDTSAADFTAADRTKLDTLAADYTTARAAKIDNLDATITSRMATYTQPTGFLAATFPGGTIANTTNITAGTITTVGSIAGITFPTNFGTFAINASGHVSRVTLVDTITTYTGNTPQTGDVFPLASTEIADIKAKTDLIPAFPASTTNITAGTITNVTNLTNAPTAGDLTAAMKASVQSEAEEAIVAKKLDLLAGADAAYGSLVAGSLYAELLENNAGIVRYTAAALINAPSGGGGSGSADWTTGEKNQIRQALGVTGTTAVTSGAGVLDLIAVLHSGTAQAGAASTITLASGASATNDLYKGQRVKIYGGTGAGQSRTITAYNGTTKVATVAWNWITTPDLSSTYAIESSTDPDVDSNLTVASGTTGAGAYALTITQKDTASVPMAGVSVWISTDTAGANVVAGTVVTNALGVAPVMNVNAAGLYYAHRTLSGKNFSNPQSFTVNTDANQAFTFTDGSVATGSGGITAVDRKEGQDQTEPGQSTPLSVVRGSRAVVRRTVVKVTQRGAESVINISGGQATAIVWHLLPNLKQGSAAILTKTLLAGDITLPNAGADGIYEFVLDDSDTVNVAPGTYKAMLAIVVGTNRIKFQPYDVTIGAGANLGE